MRKVHMENTDTAMVNLASREALRVWGMVNASGHTSMAMLWAVISSWDSLNACSDSR